MSDRPDPLALATKALKVKYDVDVEAPSPPSTRERVLERSATDVRQRRVSRLVFLPLAAAFVLFATWAAATGALQRLLQPPPEEQHGHALATGAPPAERPGPLALAPSAARVDPPAPRVDEPTPAPSAVPSGIVLAAPAASIAPAAPAASIAPAPPSAAPPAPATVEAPAPKPTASAPSPEDELYAAAHRAHFDERDYARALASWDRYLAAAPAGRLAPEARYNRAICLARLGRKDEARAALEPFASGSMGGYRKLEAQKLLDAL